MTRTYFEHRRAYYPRLWPIMAVASLITLPLLYLIGAGTPADIAVGAGVAVIVAHGRLWLWRRRHPVISPGEYLQDLRDRARWN